MPPGVALPSLAEVTEITASGRLATATIKACADEVAAAFTRANTTVREVQRMSLEEIFVANVMLNRRGGAHVSQSIVSQLVVKDLRVGVGRSSRARCYSACSRLRCRHGAASPSSLAAASASSR